MNYSLHHVGCITRLLTLDALQGSENLEIKTSYNVTDYRGETDVIWDFYLSVIIPRLFNLGCLSNNPSGTIFLGNSLDAGRVKKFLDGKNTDFYDFWKSFNFKHYFLISKSI